MKIIENVTPADPTVPENYNFEYEFGGYEDDSSSGGSALILHLEDDILDKTFNEIVTALESGQTVLVREENVGNSKTSFYHIFAYTCYEDDYDNIYALTMSYDNGNTTDLTAETKDSYPELRMINF